LGHIGDKQEGVGGVGQVFAQAGFEYGSCVDCAPVHLRLPDRLPEKFAAALVRAPCLG
jgi:hypothetical protein